MELSIKNNNEKAVLLLHGLTGTPLELRWVARDFAKANYDVYFPILPGHCSSLEELKKTKWEELYEFAKNFYLNLKAKYSEVFVAGLCVGGMLSLMLGMEFPDIDGVGSWAPAMGIDGWAIPWYRFLLPLGLYTPLKHIYYWKEKEPFGIKNEAMRKKIMQMMKSEKNEAMAYDKIPAPTIVELKRMAKYIKKRINLLKAPFILIHSKEDDLSSIKGAKFIYEKAPSKVKKFVELSNSYHIVTMDNEKDIVSGETITFFNSLSERKHQKVEAYQA
ncbi:MAG: alpha/beta hydrolase [Hydrogenobaculum sp.]